MSPKMKDFILETVVDSGATSFVWKAHHIKASPPLAVKQITIDPSSTSPAKTHVIREISLHQRTNHPFIIKLFDVIEDRNDYYLIQELAEQGNLLQLINQHQRFPEHLARKYFTQMITAAEYLHKECHIAHRDIKCENILIDNHDNIKLIDFGLSRSFNVFSDKFTTQCGSPAYIAPEIVLSNAYGPSADLWSCGMVLFGMVAGYLPFFDSDPRQNIHNICNSQLKCPLYFSSNLTDLLHKLLCKDPKNRLNIDGIIKHPWFAQREYQLISTAITSVYARFAEIDGQAIAQMNCDGIRCTQADVKVAINRSENLELVMLYQMYLRESQNRKMAAAIEQMREQSLPRIRTNWETQVKGMAMIVKRQIHSDRPAIPVIAQCFADENKEEQVDEDIRARVLTPRPTLAQCAAPPRARIVLGPSVLKKGALGRSEIKMGSGFERKGN